MDGFVEAYSKKTGKKQIVPEHWLGHEVLGKGFSKTPAQRASERLNSRYPDGDPSEGWKGDELKAYAEDYGVDLGTATKKAEMVEAIAAAKTPQTPASGDKETI